MTINAKFITFAVSLILAVIGLFEYIASTKPYLPLWVASFISLMATVGIGMADEVFDVSQELEELKNVLDKGEI